MVVVPFGAAGKSYTGRRGHGTETRTEPAEECAGGRTSHVTTAADRAAPAERPHGDTAQREVQQQSMSATEGMPTAINAS